MNQTEQAELLKTNAAKGRQPLAKFLAAQPSMTYNSAMLALKSAPRRKRVNLAEAGRAMALRLLGKVDG
jgi:hypothetical protein